MGAHTEHRHLERDGEGWETSITQMPEWQGLSLTVWDTEEHAETVAERFGPGSSPAASVSVIRCEVREVAGTA